MIKKMSKTISKESKPILSKKLSSKKQAKTSVIDELN